MVGSFKERRCHRQAREPTSSGASSCSSNLACSASRVGVICNNESDTNWMACKCGRGTRLELVFLGAGILVVDQGNFAIRKSFALKA